MEEYESLRCDGREAGTGRVVGGLVDEAEEDGSTDIRSMRSLSLSRSRSAWAPELLALSRSIWPSSWAPSERRLLTNVSTFFSRLSTVSFISE